MEERLVWYLKNYNLFADIPEKALRKIAGEIHMQECKTECSIYRPEEIPEQIYIVKKGEVALYHEKNGKKFVFDVLGAGSVFGYLDQGKGSYGHHAVGRPGVCVCVFKREQFLEIIRAYPEAMMRFMRDMSQKIQDYQDTLIQHHQTAEEIVLHELQRLHGKRQKGLLGMFGERPLRVTHAQLGELTGLNRVTVTRIMQQLREKGVIGYDAKTGVITL